MIWFILIVCYFELIDLQSNKTFSSYIGQELSETDSIINLNNFNEKSFTSLPYIRWSDMIETHSNVIVPGLNLDNSYRVRQENESRKTGLPQDYSLIQYF